MKKLSYLLDSTTIINFPFVWKLLLRYWKSSAFITILIFSISAVFYLSQSELYTTTVKFSDMNAKADPTMMAMGSLTGAKSLGGNNSADIVGLRHSRDFTQTIAERLFRNPFFYSLNFGKSLIDVNKKSGASIYRGCLGNRNCVVDTVAKIVPQFYVMIDSERTNTNYVLQVQAADKRTAMILLEEIKQALHATRVAFLKGALEGQRKVTSEMLEQNKKSLLDLNYDKKLENKALLDNQLLQLESQIDSQNKIVIEHQNNLSRMEAKVKGTRDALKKDIDYSDLSSDKKRQSLEAKIESLTNDIHALEAAEGGTTAKDDGIIAKLRQELKDVQRQLQSIKRDRHSLVSTDRFMKNTEQSMDVSEFDYKVYKKHLEKANGVLDEMISQKKELTEAQLKLQEEMEKIRPTIEFVKALESKLLHVKLMEETVTTDLRFDTFSTPPDNSKRLGKVLLFAYTMMLWSLVVMGYLVTRYLIDDRIYDEDDLRKFVGDVPIIGETPKFDD